MAEKMVSPGVFTQENDLSFLPQGIAQIGAGIIGPTVKGPAFVPTVVTSYEDFTDKFGYPDGKSYVPYAMRNYLKHSGRATVVRTAGIEGYTAQTLNIYYTPATGSSTGSVVLAAVIAHGFDSSSDMSEWTVDSPAIAGDFLSFEVSSASVAYTCSLDPASDSYFQYVLGTSPEYGTTRHIYAYAVNQSKLFTDLLTIASASISGAFSDAVLSATDGIILTGDGTDPAYKIAESPAVLSQLNTRLFNIISLSAGPSDVYVSLDNLKLSGEIPGTTYGSFNILVRKIGDTDLKPEVLETFANCNLNPVSPNFVARKIGDVRTSVIDDSNGVPKVYVTGDYAGKSKYISVQLLDSYGETEVPYGFAEYSSPLVGEASFSFSHRLIQKTDQTDTGASATTAFNFKYYLGFDQSDSDNLFVLKPLPSDSDTWTALTGSGFTLSDAQMQSGSGASTATTVWTTSSPAKSRRFSIALQGGFDGFNVVTPKNIGSEITADNVFGMDCSSPVSTGTLIYRRAVDVVSNKDEYDINMLVLPGVILEEHPAVISYANDMAEERGDTFFLFDTVGLEATVQEAIDSVEDMDSNYAGTYYPWLKMYDVDNTKYMWAPITVFMPAVFAFNDKVGAPWYAPAGLNRGGISEATQVYTRVTQAERDNLYDGRINPIVTFISQGIVAWGQKTLQVKASALDRINVRRLLIELKKYIASATKYLVFEQNTIQTRTRFLNIVNPYLDSVQQKQGLYTFKVIMDETNNTPDVIDRNEMVGTIWLQPTKTAEMIKIDFNITPTGATFGA